MKGIFNLLILVFLASGMQCSHRNKSTISDQGGNETQQQTRTSNDIRVDSSRITELLSLREKKEIGPSLSRFYKSRDLRLAWWHGNKLSDKAGMLIAKLQHADEEGLNPADFANAEMDKLFDKMKDKTGLDNEQEKEQARDLDLLLSASFCRYAIDMKEGVTRNQKEVMGWYVSESPVKYDSLLQVVLNSNAPDPFLLLEPQHPEYRKLKTLLKQYRELAKKGGWPTLTGVTKLKRGDTSEQVANLRERLAISGDLKTGATNFYNPKIFDRNVELAVKNFQTRYGLNPDGIVGGSTLEALNAPINKHIRQIIVNMERWRLVPSDLGKEFLLVNVPEFKLHVFENGAEAFSMRVIVGKEFKSTPIFSDMLQNVVFSPYWNIPKSIIAEEILPMMIKDPSYLYRHHMEAMKGFGKDAFPVKAWEVPWYNIDQDNFQYWLRQLPGNDNPLGLVKFLFPNNHNVYLHDTPADELFSSVKRTFSHGCIRVEEPFLLAKFVLKDQPEWTDDKINEAMHSGEEQFVRCRKIPVYILYFTTWVDATGKIQVRDDIYGLDQSTMTEMSI